jgi:hypothetical protein
MLFFSGRPDCNHTNQDDAGAYLDRNICRQDPAR